MATNATTHTGCTNFGEPHSLVPSSIHDTRQHCAKTNLLTDLASTAAVACLSTEKTRNLRRCKNTCCNTKICLNHVIGVPRRVDMAITKYIYRNRCQNQLQFNKQIQNMNMSSLLGVWLLRLKTSLTRWSIMGTVKPHKQPTSAFHLKRPRTAAHL